MTDAAIGAIPVAAADELESPTRRALRRLFKRKGAVVGLVVIALFLLLALFAPLIVPYDPIATSWSLVRKPPSALHWFGTDDLGRDILGRVVYGARASLMAGAISVGIALGIGVPLGLLSGYRGGFIDALISRITDAMLACPFLILAIALAAFLGPEPRQCHDRDRHLGDADLRAADPRPGDERQGRGLCRGRARDGQSALAHRAVPYLAEHHAGAFGAGDAVDRGGHHRRSRAVVPGPRPAAAGAVLGQHAQRRPTLPDQRALDGDLAGPWRSSSWCCRSTWSATACATRSIQGSGRQYAALASPRPMGRGRIAACESGRSGLKPIDGPYSLTSTLSPWRGGSPSVRLRRG